MTFKNYHTVKSSLFLFLTLLFSSHTFAAPPIYTGFLSNLAVSGYDTVAYFTDNKAVEGDARYSTEYKGATWHFSSSENRDKFEAAPEQYAPQYGGYCAWAVAHNSTAKGDPQQWEIHNGKLYLNYNANIKKRWQADKQNLIGKADRYWPGLLD